MGNRTKRLWLLIQKNYQVKKNQGFLSLLFLLLFPVIIIGFVAVFRPKVKTTENGGCHTKGYAMPSSGILPFIQSTVCGISSQCRQDEFETEKYGSIESAISSGVNGTDLSMPCNSFSGIPATSKSKNMKNYEQPALNSNNRVKRKAGAYNYFSCKELRKILDSDLISDLILDTTSFYDTLFPLMNGIIVYTPKNSNTDKIMEQVKNMYLKPINDLNSKFQIDITTLDELFNCVENASGDQDSINRCLVTFFSLSDAAPWASYISRCATPAGKRLMPADNINEMNSIIQDLQKNKTFLAGIVFNTKTDFKHITYRIRQTTLQVPATDEIADNYFQSGGQFESQKYIKGGFTMIQDMIDHALAKIIAENNNVEWNKVNVGSFLQPMPLPCHLTDNYILAMTELISILMTIGFVYPVAGMTRDMVKDKHTKIRDALVLVGADINLQRLSYLLFPGCMYFLGAVPLSIAVWAAIFVHSDWFCVFLWVLFFVWAMLGFTSFMAAISDKPTRASAISGLVWFGTYLVYKPMSAWGVNLQKWVRYLLFLFPCTAMSYSADMMGKLERVGKGITMDGEFNLGYSKNTKLYPTFCEALLFMWIDGTLGLIAAWYIEHLFPGGSNAPLPWYFLFTKKYWFGEKNQESGERRTELKNLSLKYDHEEIKGNKEAGVVLKNLTRKYKGGNLAVNDVSVEFYKGEITAYLGRNGAGKSSTLGILAGLARPTSGGVWIENFDIIKSPEKSHQLIGNCPQYNILIDELSPVEHIELYSKLRNPSKDLNNIEEETKELLEAVGLTGDRPNAPSLFLSGGMKRKLSIALCFIGKPKVIFLDEPTAGVDPEARRSIWKLLQNYHKTKKDITMIMCTHHLDEAELLGDRIVVIDGGEIKCAGSNLWMKEKYADGYVMTAIKDKHCDENKIKDLFDESKIRKGGNSSELELIIPYKTVNSEGFVKNLEKLDTGLESFGIKNYGLRDTTLEEIFIQLASSPNKDYEDVNSDNDRIKLLEEEANTRIKIKDSNSSMNFQKLEGLSLFLQQFKGIFIKRIQVSMRDWKSAISQLVLPVLFILIALSTLSKTLNLPSSTDYPDLELTPWIYEDINSFSSLENDSTIFKNLGDALNERPGWGTLCLNGYTPSTWTYGVEFAHLVGGFGGHPKKPTTAVVF